MTRILPLILGAGLVAGVTAQDLPGIKAMLSTPKSVVTAAGNVELRLAIEVTADTAVPAVLLSGMALEVKVDDKAVPKIAAAGKGGQVALTKGTRIERTLMVPTARFLESADASAFSTVAVQWAGLTGANCVFRVAPDASKVDLAAIDMAKTKALLITNYGEMTLSFRPDKAPKHVENFFKLAKSGFYDGTKFHRVIRGFMIQGGDPNSADDSKQNLWGRGDPGYKIDAEFSDIRHVRGTVSMARGPDPNSAGSQFFIVHKDAAHLDGKYTAFGNLEAGADVLDSIANVQTGRNDMPVKHVVLEAVVLLPVLK